MAHSYVFVLTLTLFCYSTAIAQEHTNNWGERAAWSRQEVRHNTLGYYDMLDWTPAMKAGSFPLEQLDGTVIDPATDYAGQTIMIVYINPQLVKGWANADCNYLKRYRRLANEFADTVIFISVYSEGRKTKRANAEKYFAECNPPGIQVIEKNYKRGEGMTNFCGLRGFGAYKSAPIAIVNADGVVSYRSYNYGFFEHAYRLNLSRITNPDFDTELRTPTASRALPLVEHNEKGLLYRDDFESYTNFSLRTSPRWGFQYFTQYRVDARAGIKKEVGRNNSQAAHLYCDYYRYKEGKIGSLWRTNLAHDFTMPLHQGAASFQLKAKSLRPGPSAVVRQQHGDSIRYQSEYATPLIITVRRGESVAPAGYILVKNDTFLVVEDTPFVRDIDEKGSVLIGDHWQALHIHMDNTGLANIFVDDTKIGTLPAQSLIGLTFRCQPGSEFYIDDVALQYNGTKSELLAQQQQYHERMHATHVGAKPFTAKPDGVFDEPENDSYKSTLHAPVETGGSIQLEQLYHPGVYVDPVAENCGKRPVFISISRDRPIACAFSRLFGEPIAHRYDLRKQLVERYNDRVAMYDLSHLYLEYVITDYEEFRDLRHEQITGKNKLRNIYGYAACWEIGAEYDTDKYLLQSFADRSYANWNRFAGKSPMTGVHSGLNGTIAAGAFALLNTDGKFVLRAGGVEHPYRDILILLEAVLHDDAIPTTDTELPIKEGSTWRDDFESYPDDQAILMAACWGFDYEKDFLSDKGAKVITGRSQKLHGSIAKGQGRNGSQALLLDTTFYLVRSFEDKHYAPHKDSAYNNWRAQIGKQHIFPKAMDNGRFSCWIKQGPKTSERRVKKGADISKDPKKDIWFVMEILDADGQMIDAIINEGGIDEPALKLENNTAGTASITMRKWRTDPFAARHPDDDTWHHIILHAENGQIQVSVDGTNIGNITAASFSGITMHTRCMASMYVDDVMLQY